MFFLFCVKKSKVRAYCEKQLSQCATAHMQLLETLPVTCHLSLTLTATATDPLPANSPTIEGTLICKNPKNQREKIFKHKKLKYLEVC